MSVAGLLHVSHFVMFTKTDVGVYLRLCRLPRGPTLTFKVHNYCLSKDVISSLRKPNLEQIQYLNHPLLVMNNFSGAGNHVKLMATMFQNMFPSINVHKVSETIICLLLWNIIYITQYRDNISTDTLIFSLWGRYLASFKTDDFFCLFLSEAWLCFKWYFFCLLLKTSCTY